LIPMAPKSPARNARSRLRPLARRRQKTGVARYYQLYALLSNALNDGTIAPGNALPSEPELARRHRLSRTTVRRALERLENENRIVRLRGSGTFARQAPAAAKLCLNLHTFYNDLPAIAAQTSVAVLRFEPEVLPAGARDLHSQLGERAFVIQRVRKFHGTPYQLSTAYVPESVGRQMRRNSLGSTSIITALDRIGPKTVSSNHTMSAVAADDVASRALDVSLGAPLLRMRAVFSDAKGRIRAIYESLSRPDHLNVRAELERVRARSAHSPWRLRASETGSARR
jgi:GntR family transcriptional regulator